MKKLLFIFLIFGVFSQNTKADTIDFWHVYYNKTKIKEFNQFGTNEIIIKLNSIKAGDSLTVRYFRDTPCPDCPSLLTVEDEQHRVFVSSKGMGTFNPVSFSLDALVELKKQGYNQPFEVFYTDGVVKGRSEKKLIFRVVIELK
ncbi:hypothetical protein [Ferruginibacter sp. SUN106]|uniref:hypothetical protein n=1 Tax=Ferruginibacter sp. SUN106 TaxID=2978348 RepID=UPI003D364839